MRVLLAVLFTTLGFAQQARLDGPTPGFVFDAATRELRPIRGFVGSAHLGRALISGADAVSVSLDGSLAVASRNGALELTRGFDSGSPVAVELGLVTPDAIFAWSGYDLVAVSAASHRASIWRNLDAKAEVSATIDLTGIDGALASVAFDGENILIAATGGLFRANKSEMKRLVELEQASAIAASGNLQFVADLGTGNVWRILGDKADLFAKVDGPVGIQITGTRLAVASKASRSVELFDLQSKEHTASLALDFLPERLEPLGSSPFSLLNRATNAEPLWVLDSRDALQVFFVPSGSVQ